MPWGPFEIDLDNPLGDSEEPPWFKLHTIYEYLYDGEPIPYPLSIWLATAIQKSGEDPNEFLELLGLKKKKGNQQKISSAKEFLLGEKVSILIRDGYSKENAISQLLLETQTEGKETSIHSLISCDTEGSEEHITRSTLQRYHNKYQALMLDSAIQNEANNIVNWIVKNIDRLLSALVVFTPISLCVRGKPSFRGRYYLSCGSSSVSCRHYFILE